VEPRDAATVLLIRDAPDLQVFMLRRNLGSAFAPGAYVFPGGAVDPADGDDALDQGGAAGGSGAGSVAGVPGRFRVAVIRESFEEAGVLLARDPSSGAPVDGASLAPARQALRRGDRSFSEIVRELDVVLDTAALWPIGRFVTPPGAPRRYDTWFFVAAAPRGHAYRHDDDETVESLWIRPEHALDESRQGGFELIEPTRRTLQTIARYPRVAPLVEAIRAAWREPSPLAGRDPRRGWVLRIGGHDANRVPARGGAETSLRPKAPA
jgi:8-oxo-dGTP pyrophosphatase MutT (NUDIX family)